MRQTLIIAICSAVTVGALVAATASLVAASPAVADTLRARTPAPTAVAAHCPNTIRLGERTYIFYTQRVRCIVARRYVRRLYETRGDTRWPDGFVCESGSRWRTGGGCHTPRYRRGFGWHPAD